jgi:hypothetical protein
MFKDVGAVIGRVTGAAVGRCVDRPRALLSDHDCTGTVKF